MWQLGVAGLREGFAQRRFDPVAACEAVLARIAHCEPQVRALVLLDAARARRDAQASALRWRQGQPLSALDGVPCTVKDNLHAAGWPTTWGSRLLRDVVPAADEAPVARLRAAGAVLLGKTNLPEFAIQGFTDNDVAGATRNPWDLARSPGGSSGGAAAAVACGYGPLALVTDGGGSARRPAAHCGVAGFKPSAGSMARGDGLPDLFQGHEEAAWIARSAADLQAMHEVMAPQAMPSRHLRRVLFVPRFDGHPVDPGITRCVGEAAANLRGLGCQVETAAGFPYAEAIHTLWPMLSAHGLAQLFLRGGEGLFGAGGDPAAACRPETRAALAAGQAVTPGDLAALEREVRALRAAMQDRLGAHDVLLTPTTAAQPWPLDRAAPGVIDGQAVGPRGHAVFTALANAAGLPAVSVPCGWSGGLPVGLQLVGRRSEDASLLALAHRFQHAAGAVAAELRWPLWSTP